MTDGGQRDGAEAAAIEARRDVLAAASGHILARAVHLAVELGLADALAGGAKTAVELAAAVAADETALRRLLHFLARHGFFTEGEDGRFATTASGSLLRSDAPANTAEVVRSLGSPVVWDAFGALAHSVRSGRPPEERRDGRLYQRKGDLPHEAMLSRAMIGYHAGEPEAVAAAYDFGAAARVVDVGGSAGNLIGAILLRHPHLHGIVYDRSGIEAEARAHLDGLGLAGRFDFAGGDFFESVPAGADLYILSHILHDWSDGDALRILAACRRAMGEGARLIVLEALITRDGGGEAEIPADMLLLANTEGRLRTVAEHRRLLDRAGLRFSRTMACGPLVSLVEAGPRPVSRPSAAPLPGAARDAVARALAFLESVQLPSGELPVYASNDPGMKTGGTPDPSVFPTALAAHSLSFCADAAPIRERALGFLEGEKDRHGLWRHWTREHPHHSQLPPDLDDTSCASAAIADPARLAGNREIILCNRRRDGLFLTWVLPRPRLGCAAHRRATWPQLRHAATLFHFFRRTSARPGDVDAVVNANALFHLGAFEGRGAVADFLLDVLRRGAEADCDKWYENPFAIRYFLSRALAAEPEAPELIARRSAAAPPASALDSALAMCASLHCGTRPAEAEVDALLALQDRDGSWPRAALYHGGRPRLAGGGFAPRHPDTPHWGSEALTTGFCVEALARWVDGS